MKNVSIYIDLTFCLIVLPMMAIIFPVERWFHNFQWYVVTVGLWLYCLYFVNRAVTVPSLFRGNLRRFLGIGIIITSIVITYLLSIVTLYEPKPNIHDSGFVKIFPSIQQYQQAVWSLFMIVESFSFAVGLLTQVNEQRMRRREVESEREKAEIQLYKAQIKPHFMFNTLNSIYGLFLTHSNNALTSLERYITMMRYIHISTRRDLVPLTDEVDYIRQYVALQSLRLNGMTEVELAIDVADGSINVPPMLLITFVENCFKFGVSPVEKSKISIKLTEKDSYLVFTTDNHIFPTQRVSEHVGIENCRRRLNLLYPSAHTLDIANDGQTFHVRLCIKL